MTDLGDTRGILRPARLPSFDRIPAPVELQDLIRWFWIPRWQIAPGRTSRQHPLPFPASNLVVDAEGVSLSGPTTGASHRDLTGIGWAVGALLRPAGLASLHAEPSKIRDTEVSHAAHELHSGVAAAMSESDEEVGRERAVALWTEWARDHLTAPDEIGLTANAMEDLISSDPTIVHVAQIAHQLHMSTRGVQRLAHRYVGVGPLTIIRRYRLQEAAKRLRENPSVTIAQIAADLGYADHAHLSSDFRRVLGLSPHSYRRET